jgi:outer membrane receptor for ferrienterochelin and colicin
MRFCIFSLFILYFGSIVSQTTNQYSFNGTVVDSTNGDFLPYALIYDTSNDRYTETDSYGRFTMKLKDGNHTLILSALGYLTKRIQVSLQNDISQIISLTHISLNEVTIQARPSIHVENNFIDISPEKLRSVPSLFGEKDVLKALTILPGVSPGYEGTNQYSVRGGGNDQNLILLDGSVLYNTSHLFGFLSAIEPYSIKSFRFYKEGFPVEYGGRLSSVADISLREGNYKQSERFFNAGVVTSSFGMNGPLIKEKLSFLMAGRIAYPGLFTLPIKYSYRNGNSNSFTSYFMYDIISKLSFTINPKNNLYLSFYTGHDYLLSGVNENNFRMDWDIDWGNSIASFRYNRILSKNINLSFNTNFNKYKYRSNLIGTEELDNTKTNIENQSMIQDLKSSLHINWNISQGLELKLGASVTNSTILPKFQFTEINNIADTFSKSNIYRSSEVSVFGNFNVKPFEALKIDLGIRQSAYHYKDYYYRIFQPRLLMGYTLPDKRYDLHVSYSQMYQPLHLIINQANGYINDVWIAASEKLPPQEMKEISIGMHGKNDAGDFRVTYFHRNYFNLTEMKDNVKLLKLSTDAWENLLEVDGNGISNGIELGYIKNFDRFNMIASYTYTKSERTFTDFNQGKSFPSPFDRKHVFNLNIDYIKNEHATLSTNLTYFTGIPVTLPAYSTFTSIGATGHVGGFDYVYNEHYNARLPSYKRIDIAYKKTKIDSKGRAKEWTISIYNLLFNRNVTQIIPFHTGVPDKDDPSVSIGFRNEFVAKSFLMFIPGINFYYKIR